MPCPNCNPLTGLGWYVVCWTYKKRRFCKLKRCRCRKVKLPKGKDREWIGFFEHKPKP